MRRVCKVCTEEKQVEEFASYLRKGARLPLRTCKDCHREQERERQRRYVGENRDAHNRRSRENKRERYRKDPEFREEMRRQSKQYYEDNKEGVLEARRERYHEEKDQFRPHFTGITSTFEDEFDELLRDG